MSNSWGGSGYSQALEDAIDAAARVGILFVAAAGNDSSNNDTTPSYPASYSSSNIVVVAATDDNDQLAFFSNYGATSVHVAAPGVGILSTFPTTMTSAMASYGLTTHYATISGTSMATPHASGVAALALAQNPGLTMGQLRSRLLERADRLTNLVGIVQTAGRLNAYNVVNPAWQPGPVQMQMTSYTLSDSEGNNDGFPNPGEILRLTPSLFNIGGQTASNVTVELVSSQATAVVLSPATLGLGVIAPFIATPAPQPWRVQLDAGLTDNAELTFDAIIRAAGVADVHRTLTLVVSKAQPRAEVTPNFTIGEMKADPFHNRVYVLDKTNWRVLALDTDIGQVVAIGGLDGSVEIAPPVQNGSLRSGQLAVSLDGTQLFVALTAASKIQIFSLPDLAPLATLPTSFAPESLACGVGGRLYASSTDYWGPIREVNTSTGQVVQQFDHGRAYYMHALLRMNAAGTRLYVGETGLRTVGGPADIAEFDVTGASAALVQSYYYWQVYMNDFGVDEQQQRIYTLNGGIYGVQVTHMDTGVYGEVWPFDSPYAAAVAFLSNAPVVYGASYSAIDKFRRSDGTKLGTYNIGSIPPRGLTITPNGNLLYYNGNNIGIIGLSSLNISNPPPQPSAANLVLSTVDFSDAEGNSNSIPNAGEIISLTPQVRNTGGQVASNAMVELVAGSGASNLSENVQSFGSLAPGAVVQAGAYRVQLAEALPTGTVVPFAIITHWNTSQVKTSVYTLAVQGMIVTNEVAATFPIGEILPDQQRNLVYLIDKQALRVLTFDTNLGHPTLAVNLAGPHLVNGAPPEPGQMAESVDGSKLYVALKKSKMIQVFSLPDLNSLASWSFSFEPVGIACDASNRVYVTTTDTSQKLVQIDGATGQVLSQTGAPFGINSVLRRNAAGTELFASYDGGSSCVVYRFDTSGSSAPVQLAVLSLGISNGIIDLAVDETNARCYAMLWWPALMVVPFDGSPASSWTFLGSFGTAVALRPDGSSVFTGATGGGIRRHDRQTGAAVQDYAVGAISNRGLAITPNGRVVYVKGSSLGMIGGPVDLDIPGRDPIVLKSVAFKDPPPANTNGYANPGETVELTPTFKNVSDFRWDAVQVDLISSDPRAVVFSPVTRVFSNVNGYATFVPSTRYQVQLDSSLADGTEIALTFHITRDGGNTQDLVWRLYITKIDQAVATTSFTPGDMIADRTRNLAYVVDKTNWRLLAIDTAAGKVTANIGLLGNPGNGQLAIAPTGNQLYVGFSASNKVQVINLPSLEQADIWDVGFAPVSLAAAADGKLYSTSTNTWGMIWQVDPATGQTLGQFGRQIYYANSLLRLSGDASMLYIIETGLSGTRSIDAYAIGMSGMPVFTKGLPVSLSNTKDLAIDEIYRQFYLIQGGTYAGAYGIGLLGMDTAVTGVWPFGAAYGAAICFLPDSKFVYGASPSRIRRFLRADGRPLADIAATVRDRAMVVTPNGRVLYGPATNSLGIIGSTSLTINSTNQAPLIYLGTNLTVRLSQGAPLKATVSDDGPISSLTTTWEIVSGADGAFVSAISLTNAVVSFASTGTYVIRGTVSDGALTGSDLITVTVQPDKPAVSVTASKPVATRAGPIAGEFTFSRTQVPTNALTVTYTVTGAATGGVDYAALSGTANFPAGAVTVTANVTPLPGAPSFGTGKAVVVTIATNANFDLGISQQATVTLKDHDSTAWRAAKLGGVSTANQLDTADPDGDGIVNLMEYALGLDPLTANVSGLPTLSKAGDHLTLTYERRKAPVDVTYTIEASSEPGSGWSSTGITEEILADDGLFQTVRATDPAPMSANPKRFIRLKINRP